MKYIYAILKSIQIYSCKLFTVYFLLSTVSVHAQHFINAQLTTMPPYSQYLNDYAIGTNIQLNLVQRDITREPQEVYLNIELESGDLRLKTLPSFRPSSYIEVIPGAMLMLTNVDIAEYLNIHSLSFEGISKEAFNANAQQLPEGLYKIKIKAILKNTGSQASNEAISLLGIQKGKPPFINLPMHKSKVPENATQNFIIQWTNVNMVYGQVGPPSYRIQMWEMLDPTQDPNVIANSNYPPILDDYTNVSTYQYGLSNIPLTAGKSYALRVQVLEPEGRDVYGNGGYSQVVRFIYGDPCEPPSHLSATLDSRGIVVNWATVPGRGYHLQYSRIDTAWQETETLMSRFSIEKTYPSAQYQMRVALLCYGGKQSEYSDIVTINTKPSGSNNQAACGDPFPKIDIKNHRLLPGLKVGDKFTSFDFDVTVTRVLRNDSNSYAGEGTTPFNMLGGIPTVVYFDGIKINTDRQHFNEVPVKFQQKPYVFSDKDLKQFKDDFQDTKERFTGDDAAKPEAVNVNVTIGTVSYDSSKKQIVITNTVGATLAVVSSGKDYRITDKDGNVFLVSKDNKITKQPKATESMVQHGGPIKGGGENFDIHFTEDQPVLSFVAHPEQVYGFDASYMNSMGESLYESIINTSSVYYVPYKSIASSGTDKIVAKVDANPENVDLKRIKFKTNTGIAVPFAYDSLKLQWTLTITAGLHRNDFSVFPYYGNGKDTHCGKLNVMPLDRKEVNLVLIPLNGYKASSIKQVDIESYLNKVYNQANIAYKVTLDGAFSSAAADQPLSVEHGHLKGEYSENQARVIADYSVAHPEQDNTIYLFLCKEGSNDVVKGHTPVNRSYGFLFGESLDKRTIAHEIGHGYPLALEHPFTEGGATGTYTNLMDYASGLNLSFKQWGLAHNPKLKVRFGQSSDKGQMLANRYYYRPDGKIFKPDVDAREELQAVQIQGGEYPNGAVYVFTINGVEYKAVILSNGFRGYYPNGDTLKKRYAPEIGDVKGQTLRVIYTKSIGKCGWERIMTIFKNVSDLDILWPNEGMGYPLATAIPMLNAKMYESGKFYNCEEFDEDAEPQANTLGAEFYEDNRLVKDPADRQYIKKTANLINKLGPDIYKAFYTIAKTDENIQNYAWLEAILLAYKVRAKKDGTPWKVVYESIKHFSEGVDGLNNRNFGNSKEFVDFVNAYFVNTASAFRYFFDAPFTRLTTDRRNQLLSLYGKANPADISGQGNISNPIGDKEVIVALIRHIDPKDSKRLLDHLYNDKILGAVMASFDSYMYGGMEEFSTLISCLSRMVDKAYPVSGFEREYQLASPFDYIKGNKYLYFDNAYLGDNNTEYVTESGELGFAIKPLHPFKDKSTYNVFCSPYSHLLVRFKQDVELGKAKFRAGNAYKLHAVTVYLLFSQNTRQKLMKSAEITVDVASLAIGVGALNAAVRTARLGMIAYEAFELANDVVGISVDLYEEDLKTYSPGFYNGWMIYSRAFTISKWSAKLTGADESMRMLVGEQYFGSRKMLNNASVPPKVQEFAAEYRNHLEEQYPDYIDEINQYLVGTRAKFDPSFRDKMDDILVDYIRNKLTNEQIAKLNDEIRAKPLFLGELNSEPKKLDGWVNPTRLVEGKNIFRGFSADYAKAKTTFNQFRENQRHLIRKNYTGIELADELQKFDSRNLAYFEGNINNLSLKADDIKISGGKFEGEEIFSSYKVDKFGNVNSMGAWSREFDTEYVGLSEIAKKLGAKKGGRYVSVTGEITIASELPYCISCQGVIQDFANMFPNVKINLVDGLKTMK